jgi:hypothetical protein
MDMEGAGIAATPHSAVSSACDGSGVITLASASRFRAIEFCPGEGAVQKPHPHLAFSGAKYRVGLMNMSCAAATVTAVSRSPAPIAIARPGFESWFRRDMTYSLRLGGGSGGVFGGSGRVGRRICRGFLGQPDLDFTHAGQAEYPACTGGIDAVLGGSTTVNSSRGATASAMSTERNSLAR